MSKRYQVTHRLYAKDIKEMHVMPELLNRLPGNSAGETSVKIQGATNVRVLLVADQSMIHHLLIAV